MNATIPSDLLNLKIRFEAWRKSRKYVREPIPNELRRAASDMSRRYPSSLIRQVLKVDPSRLKNTLAKRATRSAVRKESQTAFFELPTGVALPEPISSSPSERAVGCRLEFQRPDGAKLTLFLPGLENAVISTLCSNFLCS
jgi:hypothetical protein